MSKDKIGFSKFLNEFATGALPGAFSAQVLSQVPNLRGDSKGTNERNPKKLKQLKKAIKDRPTQDYGDEDGAEDDQKLFSILKSFLGHKDGEEEEKDEHPAEVDHDELEDVDSGDGEGDEEGHNDNEMEDSLDDIDAGDGDESELDPDNIGPFTAHDDVNDSPHAGDTADDDYEDEKHSQLMAAINDLRDEIKTSKSKKPQPSEGGVGGIGDMGSMGKLVGFSREENEEDNEETDEEDDQEGVKYQAAQQLFTAMVNQKKPRKAIIDQMMKQIGVTDSTATSYYQRLAKDAGITNSGDRQIADPGTPQLGQAAGFDPMQGAGGQAGAEAGMGTEPPPEETNVTGVEVEGDPNRQGLIRTVKGAHLIYKRKNEEGTFDELWVFGTGDDMKKTLEVRRAILAGTDIPPRATKSENGAQTYTLTSMGNGQILNIKGLPN